MANSSSSLPDLAAMLVNLGGLIDPVISLVQITILVIGVYLVSMSLFDFWGVSNQNIQKYLSGASRITVSGAIAKLLVGSVFISLATLEMVGILSRSVTGDSAEARMTSDGLTYVQNASLDEQAKLAALVVLGILQVLGLVAMSKGLLTVNKHYSGQSREGIGTAMAWLIGGLCAWNFRFFTEVLNNTIAPGAHVLDIFYFG